MFFKLIKQYLRSTPKGPFNREVRIKAGFSNWEMQELERQDALFKANKLKKQSN